MPKDNISIGLIGGYDLEEILENKKWIKTKTDYGNPSGKIAIGKIAGKGVAVIARHGSKHRIPPHKINHLANIQALHKLGVKYIICTAAVGIISKKIKPGSFILPHDFIDFRFQDTTFYDCFEKEVKHVDMANPYSEHLRKKVKKAAENLKIKLYDKGIYANSVGPRFETLAEIRAFRTLGADIVGMTNAPEVILANELGIQIATIAAGTNMAAGISKRTVSYEEVEERMALMNNKLKLLIKRVIRIL